MINVIEHQQLERNTMHEEGVFSGKDLLERSRLIQEKYREYFRITLEELGVASTSQTEELKKWALEFPLDEKEIAEREHFYNVDYQQRLESGKNLYKVFATHIQEAANKKNISKKSAHEWMKRFKDPSINYKQREYWVEHQLPEYKKNWEKVANERQELLKLKEFKNILNLDPSLNILKPEREEDFLDLHFDNRVNLIKRAKAAIESIKKQREQCYKDANQILENAVSEGVLSKYKTGKWLEKILNEKNTVQDIQDFIVGKNSNSLSVLIQNWREVQQRFIQATKKFNTTNEKTMPRGLPQLTTQKFLDLHYRQRLSYVKELEDRLHESPSIEKELPIFIEIRHAIDMKDWEEATKLMTRAKMMNIDDVQKKRLRSMEEYASQFTKEKSEDEESDKDENEKMVSVREAHNRIGTVLAHMQSTHPGMVPLVRRLLQSRMPNRALHQLRWITYNNIWCRTHGPPWLDDDIARKGASEDAIAMTKYRAEHGLDVGRNDSLSTETADLAYIRDKEIAKKKATLLHANLASGGVQGTLAGEMEREQHPKWLYWTTVNFHSDGHPYSENWHRDLVSYLTELRSESRTIANAGFR